MPKEQHPAIATSKHPSLIRFTWRYFTGHHLDGIHRTNATWLRKGTAPAHHVNWWNAKPRLHRAAWRWALVVIPSLWGLAYSYSPKFSVNVTVLVTLSALPYLVHHGVSRMLSLLPRRTVVYVQDNIRAEDISGDLDDEALPQMVLGETDDIQDMLDSEVAKIDTNTPLRGRRPNLRMPYE